MARLVKGLFETRTGKKSVKAGTVGLCAFSPSLGVAYAEVEKVTVRAATGTRGETRETRYTGGFYTARDFGDVVLLDTPVRDIPIDGQAAYDNLRSIVRKAHADADAAKTEKTGNGKR
jgi:hypothetical protein